MKIAHKTFTGIEWKASKQGAFRATIARLDLGADKDGDVYVGPEAFPVGKAIVISGYNHSSWSGVLPVGSGTVDADSAKAWVDGEFFLDTTNGRDTYETVKALAEKGQGEWSFGYDALDYSTSYDDLAGRGEGARRLLKRLDIFEASPVLRGAGVGTRTDYIKSTPAIGCDLGAGELAELQGIKAGLGRFDRSDWIKYAVVTKGSVPAPTRNLAEQVLEYCGHQLGLGPVKMRWIDEVDPHEEDPFDGGLWESISFSQHVYGAADPKDSTIWIRKDLEGEQLVKTVAHECAHIAGVLGDEEEHPKAYAFGRKVLGAWLAQYQPVDLWIEREGIDGYSLATWQRITVPAWALSGGVR